MPKNLYRGRGNQRRVAQNQDDGSGNGKHFYSHDNRGANNKFRGNVKSGRIDRHRRNVDPSRLKQIVEQDVDMGAGEGTTIEARRGGGYSRHDRRAHVPRHVQNISGEADWRKVTISHGKRFEKEFILKTLMNASRVPFIPIYYHEEGKNTVFFIEGAPAADALQSISGQIALPDGFKVILFVKNARPPNIPINEELREKLKLVMSKRYNAASKTLNLSKFYCDEELCTQYYAPLSRENVFHAVVKIIADNIPDVESVDLSANKLHNLEALKNLKNNATQLKLLILTNNKISQITSLDSLEGVSLKSLALNQNPVCNRFTDQTAYVSAVRKRFPKLMFLDGVELPPVISFDIEADDVVIPPAQPSWFASPEIKAIVLQFLEAYVSVYDSDDRQRLLEAYHDSAVMSLTCSNLPGQQAERSSRLDAYIRDNRNLRRVESSTQRFKLLQKGKVDIVSFLSKLPKTTHDPLSLVVDVPVASNALIVASLTGIFKERLERQQTLRWFQRVFVIIQSANGWCITNEQLHITNASIDQAKGAFKDVPAPTSVAPLNVPQPAIVENTEPSVDVLRTQMVLSFSEQSGMNLEWSSKCLEDNNWNFDHAAYIFGQMKTNNQIPPEAFIKPLSGS